MTDYEISNNLFRPSVSPKIGGGLTLIGGDGSSIAIADSEVEAFIEDIQAVRRKQLISDCNRICRPICLEPGINWPDND